jgi:hypothetical protein
VDLPSDHRPGRRLPILWPESQRELPDVSRFCLSAEQLFEPMVVWAAGANPLAWTELQPEAHTEREAMYRRQLPEAVSWLSGTRTFDEQLIAEAETRAAQQPDS